MVVMTNCGFLTISLHTGAPLPFLITTAKERRGGDWTSGRGQYSSSVIVCSNVESSGADGGGPIKCICAM